MARIVTFGELMLRLKAPRHERLLQSPTLEATFGGAEANVAVSLATFGHDAAFVTALPATPVADAAIGELRRFGVDVSPIVRREGRMGLYYLEAGANQRPSNVVYDRAGSAIALASPEEIDWATVLKGADMFMISGITPALSRSAADLSLQAVAAAKAAGITVVCDFNYRSKLWQYGVAPHEVMVDLVRHVDVIVASAADCEKFLNVTLPNPTDEEAVTAEVMQAFPGLRLMATTLREGHSANHNGWAACLRDAGGFYTSRKYEMTDIIDRVGGGDAFTAGLIHGLCTKMAAQDMLEFAVAASCLKHAIPGDFNRVTVDEVMQLVQGDGSGRVQR